MEIDLVDYYYKNKSRNDRVSRTELHASQISHCITKACYNVLSSEKDIQLNFGQKSINRMETGKAIHLLYQEQIDLKLSELKLDKFGWFPSTVREDVLHSEEVEIETIYNFSDLNIYGTWDEVKEDSSGLFIEDIKVTFGYKYKDEPSIDHRIQLHCYMLSSEMVPTKFGKISRARVKYINPFSPLQVKIFQVPYDQKLADYIEEQIFKFYEFTKTSDVPEPNYKYLSKWECDAKYCPYAKDSPLGEDCPYRRP